MARRSTNESGFPMGDGQREAAGAGRRSRPEDGRLPGLSHVRPGLIQRSARIAMAGSELVERNFHSLTPEKSFQVEP